MGHKLMDRQARRDEVTAHLEIRISLVRCLHQKECRERVELLQGQLSLCTVLNRFFCMWISWWSAVRQTCASQNRVCAATSLPLPEWPQSGNSSASSASVPQPCEPILAHAHVMCRSRGPALLNLWLVSASVYVIHADVKGIL